jgi:translation initiation factor IF-2
LPVQDGTGRPGELDLSTVAGPGAGDGTAEEGALRGRADREPADPVAVLPASTQGFGHLGGLDIAKKADPLQAEGPLSEHAPRQLQQKPDEHGAGNHGLSADPVGPGQPDERPQVQLAATFRDRRGFGGGSGNPGGPVPRAQERVGRNRDPTARLAACPAPDRFPVDRLPGGPRPGGPRPGVGAGGRGHRHGFALRALGPRAEPVAGVLERVDDTGEAVLKDRAPPL